MRYEIKNNKVYTWEGTEYCGRWIEMLSFDSKPEAENYLIQNNYEKSCYNGTKKTYFYPSGTYLLSYGEYERPEYVIRKFRNINKYGIYQISFYYNGTFNAPKDGFLLKGY